MKKSPQGALLAFIRAHVDHTGRECLTWPFGKSSNGYGAVRYGGKQMPAHRVMCIEAHGPPSKVEDEAAHTCGKGNLGCVNPRHLRWASASENQQDRRLHGTDMRGAKHHHAVLSESDVLALRQQFSGGNRSYKAVAAAMGVTPATVRRAVLGITWSHI